MNSKYLHCSFYVDLKPFIFWNRNLELKAAPLWKVRRIALVQVSCCHLLRSDATSWVRNTKDVPAAGAVLLGREVQLWQSSAQKEGKVGGVRTFENLCCSISIHACWRGWKHDSKGRKAFGEVHVLLWFGRRVVWSCFWHQNWNICLVLF